MKIVQVPHRVLTGPAQTVKVFDKKLTQLIGEMKQTLIATRNPKGVGLAAPQVGVALRLFLTRPTEEAKIRVFINPEIISTSPEKTDGVPERDNKLEGCLSIPKIWGQVKRNQKLKLKYQDEQGQIHEEEFSGFMATIIQHETDHTNGILFTQRVVEQQGKLYEQITSDDKETLEEIKL